jgi:hypothetical protein
MKAVTSTPQAFDPCHGEAEFDVGDGEGRLGQPVIDVVPVAGGFE